MTGDEGVVFFVCLVELGETDGFCFVFGKEVIVDKLIEELECLVVSESAWEHSPMADAVGDVWVECV